MSEITVAAIAFVNMDAPNLDARQHLNLGDDGEEGVVVIRVAVRSLGMTHELAAFGLAHRGRHRDLAAERTGRPSLTLADALDLGGMQAAELPVTLALALPMHLIGTRVDMYKERTEGGDGNGAARQDSGRRIGFRCKLNQLRKR